jgi:hypothetical protein
MPADPTDPILPTLPPTHFGYMNGQGGDTILNEFHFEGEMGPVADMSTFPPTMASNQPDDNTGMMSMDSILSNGFWDSVLMPGEYDSVVGSARANLSAPNRVLQFYGGT